MRKLVLATHNSGKIKEFERLLSEFVSDVQVLGLKDFPDNFLVMKPLFNPTAIPLATCPGALAIFDLTNIYVLIY